MGGEPAKPSRIVSRANLMEILTELDQHEMIEESGQDLIIDFADVLVREVVKSACETAVIRKSSELTSKDISFVLEKYYKVYVAGNDYGNLVKNSNFSAHKERMAFVRRARRK
ncbi:Transcription initiation factor TFIID subunit 12 [Thelohanellus kitauei]|uniref:Transcription initiation factor TFIID subunit 12 n=1 Tax=Thelohanellus kitauei TaxID=669202 RepID=A0A0C2J5X5_THEKT|nr:Transcription initiation factor TFIID subunit 12 [Thelohanellus kitauei]